MHNGKIEATRAGLFTYRIEERRREIVAVYRSVENRRNFDMQADASARSATTYRTTNMSSISGRTEGLAATTAAE
jgi:hypothetical protein